MLKELTKLSTEINAKVQLHENGIETRCDIHAPEGFVWFSEEDVLSIVWKKRTQEKSIKELISKMKMGLKRKSRDKMESFDYYAGQYGSNQYLYYAYSDFQDEFHNQINQINNDFLTAAERDKKLKDLKISHKETLKNKNRPYHERQQELEREFWDHSREVLGYGNRSQKQIEKLESYAYAEGHSGGYSEIFGSLQQIVDFVDDFEKD